MYNNKKPQRWNFLRLESISWRLCIHSYSPYLESNVPFCNDLSLSVNLCPNSWNPTLFSLRNCNKQSNTTMQNKLIDADLVSKARTVILSNPMSLLHKNIGQVTPWQHNVANRKHSNNANCQQSCYPLFPLEIIYQYRSDTGFALRNFLIMHCGLP